MPQATKHQLGIRGEVKSCWKILDDIKQILQESYDKKQHSADWYMSGLISMRRMRMLCKITLII